MIWTKGDDYHIHSEGFFVSKAKTESGWKYVLARKGELLGVFDSADEAKAAALGYPKGGKK